MAKIKEKDVFDKLLDYYQSFREYIPNHREAKKIVEIRFTEEEAEIALKLPGWLKGGITSKALAKEIDMDAEELEELLDRKACDGAFFARENKETGEVSYSIWDFGRLSGFYQPGRTDKMFIETSKLNEKMWKKGTNPPSGYPMSRVIPYAKGIAEGEKITPTDTVEYTTEKARTIAVAGCPCRIALQKCDHEVMNCIHFDDMADYFVKYQGGRYLTPEECKTLIEENVENGLITTLANYQSILFGYCLCCTDCCNPIIRPYVESHNQQAVEKSNFRPQYDLSKCNRCQKCMKSCPVEAIARHPAPRGTSKKEDTMFVFDDRCIGCGVCVAQCEDDALKLYRVDEKVPELRPVDAVKRHAAERMI